MYFLAFKARTDAKQDHSSWPFNPVVRANFAIGPLPNSELSRAIQLASLRPAFESPGWCRGRILEDVRGFSFRVHSPLGLRGLGGPQAERSTRCQDSNRPAVRKSSAKSPSIGSYLESESRFIGTSSVRCSCDIENLIFCVSCQRTFRFTS